MQLGSLRLGCREALSSQLGKLQPAVDKAAAAIRGGRSAEHVAVVGKHGGNVPETRSPL